MKGKPTTAQLIILIAGAVTLLFSFFPWFGEGDFSINAWEGDVFPLFTYVPLIGLVMAGVLALQLFAGTNLPAQILGFTWKQIHIALGFFATLLAIGIFIFGEDAKIGLFMCLLGSIGLLVGAIMYQREPEVAAAGPGPGTTPPTPF